MVSARVSPLRVVMVAAECKGLAKVGGLADVVHDLGMALRKEHVQVSVLLPHYASINADSKPDSRLTTSFGGQQWETEVRRTNIGDLAVYLVGQPSFFGGDYGSVYFDSSSMGRGPFEDDARRFAFFSRACAQLLSVHPDMAMPDVVHCHDWHSAFIPILARMTTQFRQLGAKSSFLFTIHNLDYQGVRPISASSSGTMESLEGYYPDCFQDIISHPLLGLIKDPRYDDCFNPMRAGIVISDMVNTVSPSYAEEITLPDNPARNFFGGRGLEETLQHVKTAGRLAGFLNGICYDEYNPAALTPPLHEHGRLMEAKAEHKRQLLSMLKKRFHRPPVHNGLPFTRDGWPDEERFIAQPLGVSVTRLASQKVGLFFERNAEGETVLEALSHLPMTTMLLGTGPLEEPFRDEVVATTGPFLYLLPFFDAELANKLYVAGDFFLMPSDFEPCGISQMIAMRHGTIPAAARVGGLQDTITHGETGYLFTGRSRPEAASAFVETVALACRLWTQDKAAFRTMQANAMAARFTWEQSASRYIDIYYKLASR